MWNSRSQRLANQAGIQVSINFDSTPASYMETLRLWQDDPEFRSMFIGLLADCPFPAFRWETPPISSSTAKRPFEFVLLDSPGLARTADASAFAAHFRNVAAVQEGVVEFPNLGHDGIMIAPCPTGPLSAYGHLGAFVREAPDAQKHALWSLVGAAMQRRLGAQPVWLSTAGAGVSWLHVRLDDRPKYYSYSLYRDAE